VVNAAVPVGETVTCDACHNSATATLSEVTFPSGVVVSGLGPEARCMVCHQGRASKVQVDAAIEANGLTEDVDKVSEPQGDPPTSLRFTNVHYFPAAATLYAGEVMGGYQYDGKMYDAKNDHVPGYATCAGCHDTHTLEVKVEECAVCHEGVTSVEDLKNVRMVSSEPDYDGDGDLEEGMFFEIEGLREVLYAAMQEYATSVAGTGLVYDVAAYPYFFADADGDGAADTGDDGSPVAFASWTARLAKAAYNFQLSLKDPGAHAHGNKYIIQLLYDSVEDLNANLGTIDMAAFNRDDAGHFAGNTEAFRHWDEEGEVPGGCAKCHSAEGLPMFIENNGSVIAVDTANGFQCSTCHDEANWPANYAINTVTFPSGKSVTFGEANPSNLCLMCHQGRESTASVDKTIGKFGDAADAVALKDDGTSALSFRNIHYFAAGSTVFGNEVQGAYQFSGKEYVGHFLHPNAEATCLSCHDAHALEPKVETCETCHGSTDTASFRMQSGDIDGDAVDEGLKGELDTLAEALYAAITAYAAENAVGIVYDSHTYPYFLEDADGDGVADVNAEGDAVRFTQWTPNLLRAAFNYQYFQKDPGAYVHNGTYVAQFLIDSIEAVGGDISAFTRPEVPPSE
jgi:hypothetical protein